VTFIESVARWLLDPAHWQGRDGVPVRVLEHVEISATAIAIASLVALPVGLWLGHTGRFAFVAINLASVGRALPSLALLGIGLLISIALFPTAALGTPPTLIALVPLAIPPILTNTFVAIRTADRDTVEAARGMGMRELQVLRAVEIPHGLPLIVAGLRTASVNVVATATLGALVAGGALGRYIVDGLALQEYDRLAAGALLVALLAVAVEVAFGALERSSRRGA
jgi:osmoprotectant transport system permease protein